MSLNPCHSYHLSAFKFDLLANLILPVQCLPLNMLNFISLKLLVQASLAISIPVIENGMGENKLGPEVMITDFAVLTLNNPDVNLPSDFTICSSVSSDTFLGFLSPFQLVQEDGTPWISVRIEPAQKDSRRHRMIFFVSIDFKSFSQIFSGRLKCPCLCKHRDSFAPPAMDLASLVCCN